MCEFIIFKIAKYDKKKGCCLKVRAYMKHADFCATVCHPGVSVNVKLKLINPIETKSDKHAALFLIESVSLNYSTIKYKVKEWDIYYPNYYFWRQCQLTKKKEKYNRNKTTYGFAKVYSNKEPVELRIIEEYITEMIIVPIIKNTNML